MDVSTELPAQRAKEAQAGLRRRVWLVVAVCLGVVMVDQLTKAWAWRHGHTVRINSGGDMFVSPVVSSWLRSPAFGAVFDVADAVLLAALAALLLRRRRPPTVLFFGALALAGWSSNLADRLGLHYWTAPGSVRGVVDFMPWDGRCWNVADFVIATGTAGFAVSVLATGARALAHRARRWRAPRAAPRRRIGALGLVALACGLLATIALAIAGAVSYAGVSAPGMFAYGGA